MYAHTHTPSKPNKQTNRQVRRAGRAQEARAAGGGRGQGRAEQQEAAHGRGQGGQAGAAPRIPGAGGRARRALPLHGQGPRGHPLRGAPAPVGHPPAPLRVRQRGGRAPRDGQDGAGRGGPRGGGALGAAAAGGAPDGHHHARCAPVAPRHARAHDGHCRGRQDRRPGAEPRLLLRVLGRRHVRRLLPLPPRGWVWVARVWGVRGVCMFDWMQWIA